MLAVLKAIEYFRTYLEGEKFSLHTDHSALKELLTTKEPKDKTARWIHKLAELDFVVVHKPGMEARGVNNGIHGLLTFEDQQSTRG